MGAVQERPRGRVPRWLVIAAGVVGALATFVAITGATGLPGPGPLRRYPTAELTQVVDALHAEAGELRTPDDCWRRRADDPGPLRDIARIDLLGSRVVVRAWAGDDGVVDVITRKRIERHVDAVLDDLPHLERDVVRIEASVDGWRPELDCRRPVTEF
jgi:hypothetical protein